MNARASSFAENTVLPACQKLVETATQLEVEIFKHYPREVPFGRGNSIKEFVECVWDSMPLVVRVLLGELDASTLEVLRGEAERGAGAGNLEPEQVRLFVLTKASHTVFYCPVWRTHHLPSVPW